MAEVALVCRYVSSSLLLLVTILAVFGLSSPSHYANELVSSICESERWRLCCDSPDCEELWSSPLYRLSRDAVRILSTTTLPFLAGINASYSELLSIISFYIFS